MPFLDRTTLVDLITVGLSETPEHQGHLPLMLPCPYRHTAVLHFVHECGVEIPTYACSSCTVTYRYHELMNHEKH